MICCFNIRLFLIKIDINPYFGANISAQLCKNNTLQKKI